MESWIENGEIIHEMAMTQLLYYSHYCVPNSFDPILTLFNFKVIPVSNLTHFHFILLFFLSLQKLFLSIVFREVNVFLYKMYTRLSEVVQHSSVLIKTFLIVGEDYGH